MADATAAFRVVIAQPGIAEAFDRDCEGLPPRTSTARPGGLIPDPRIDVQWLLDRQEKLLGKELTVRDCSAFVAAVARHRVHNPNIEVGSPDVFWQAGTPAPRTLVRGAGVLSPAGWTATAGGVTGLGTGGPAC